MIYDLELLTPPADRLLTLGQVKSHLNLQHTAEDPRLEMYAEMAEERVGAMAGRALVRSQWRLWLNKWPATKRVICLPLGQVSTPVVVKYHVAGVAEPLVMQSSWYQVLTGDGGGLILEEGCWWPAGLLRPARGVGVEFWAGWSGAVNVPGVFRQAALLLVSKMYQELEGSEEGERIDRSVRGLVNSRSLV